jgi:hypothetical protein
MALPKVSGIVNSLGIMACLWTSGAFATDAGFRLTSTAPLYTSEGPSLWRWSHGALITLDMGSPLVKRFTIFDRNGSILSRSDFSIPDATRLWVNGYDRDYSGNLVFCGEAYSSDGRLAPFIGLKSTQNGDTQLIRTYPYWPILLSVAPDGTIWTVGGERTSDGKSSGPGVNPNGDAVRHFDRSGKLIGSAFPQQGIVPRSRRIYGYLVATNDRLGWYAPLDGQATYVELSPSLNDYKVYHGISDERSRVLGFTLTDSGKAFITDDTQGKRATYTLDRVSDQWTAIPLPQSESLVLEGSETETLVFERAKRLLFFEATP